MTDNDPLQMQIQMIRAQAETQKNMFRQMYASDPGMVEHLCSQLDQTTEMQIQMITQMMGAAGPDGVVDPDAQARMVLEQLGYGEEEMGQLLGGEQEDTITEEVLGDIVPAEFGYGDIVTAISSLASLSEEHPAPADPERMRRFEVLLTGIISVLNDHKLDGLDVEPRDQDSRDLVLSILSDYWGVEDRDDLIGVLTLTDLSVSTSGDYERFFMKDGVRYHHILDARTGYPADSGLMSVSVIHENGALCDALSTAGFILGLEDGMALMDIYDAMAIFIDTERNVYYNDEAVRGFLDFQGTEKGYTLTPYR